MEHVDLAAKLGCGHISTGLVSIPWRLQRFPAWSLRDNAGLRRELVAALRDRGIVISQAEGFSVRPTTNIDDYIPDLDIFAELGARRASGVCTEKDTSRALDLLAALADLTAERGMGFTLEFAPPHAIGNLGAAHAALVALRKPNVSLVIDAMHFFRSGGTIMHLRALPPELIGYVQLCDVPRQPPHDDYLREACFERRAPGDGDLPLTEFCAALPNTVEVGIEIPALQHAHEEIQHREFVRRANAAARRLLACTDAFDQ
jgi:sugar phosphate isomerase/epimerase